MVPAGIQEPEFCGGFQTLEATGGLFLTTRIQASGLAIKQGNGKWTWNRKSSDFSTGASEFFFFPSLVGPSVVIRDWPEAWLK